MYKVVNVPNQLVKWPGTWWRTLNINKFTCIDEKKIFRFWDVDLLFLRGLLFLQGQHQERSNGESEIDTEAPSRVASM